MTLAQTLLDWYDREKRRFAFRGTRDPYRVWVSEIMLQQTRTETVEDYFRRFMTRFPTVQALADADEEDVMKLWEGLGYYSRARNLHACAREVCSRFGGVFPSSPETLATLPGIGPYTAAAVASIAFDAPVPAMDGNLTRVFARVFGVRENVDAPSVRRRLYELALGCMPGVRNGEFNQALMDLGATVCTPGTPACGRCPIRGFCQAQAAGDAELLPVKSRKAPPRTVAQTVYLIFCRGRVLMTRRTENLLKNLWVYPMAEKGASLPFPLPGEGTPLCRARHVFTHLIWEMEVRRVTVDTPFQAEGFVWVTADEMAELPMPTAVRAAREQAEALLCPQVVPLAVTDLPAAARAWALSWQAAHRSHSDPSFVALHTPAHMEAALRAHLRSGGVSYALSLHGEVCGLMNLNPAANELCQLYVLPAFQHLGLGRAAMAVAAARLDPARPALVTVLQDNAVARRLYIASGFQPTGRIRVLNARTGLAEEDLVRPPQNTP